MNGAKIRLSPEEMRLANDPSWILTKNSVMAKMVAFMAELNEAYQLRWNGARDAHREGHHNMLQGGKISKGENYQGLPYVMLDYPRLFGHHDILAIRTMFWWGHYFSLTLHLKGKYKDRFLVAIRKEKERLASAGFLVAVSDEEWRHELSEDHYRPLQEADFWEDTSERRDAAPGFLKLSAKVELGGDPGDRLLRLYELVISVLFDPHAGSRRDQP